MAAITAPPLAPHLGHAAEADPRLAVPVCAAAMIAIKLQLTPRCPGALPRDAAVLADAVEQKVDVARVRWHLPLVSPRSSSCWTHFLCNADWTEQISKLAFLTGVQGPLQPWLSGVLHAPMPPARST